jgi:hypothetical protein
MDLLNKLVRQADINNPTKVTRKMLKARIFIPLEEIKNNIASLTKFTLAEII